jgi:hypothetical protein
MDARCSMPAESPSAKVMLRSSLSTEDLELIHRTYVEKNTAHGGERERHVGPELEHRMDDAHVQPVVGVREGLPCVQALLC